MRIALLTYRGNMFCGGQGVYAAALANALHALGHEVHVIAGPPLPDLAPGRAAPRDPERELLRPADGAGAAQDESVPRARFPGTSGSSG